MLANFGIFYRQDRKQSVHRTRLIQTAIGKKITEGADSNDSSQSSIHDSASVMCDNSGFADI